MCGCSLPKPFSLGLLDSRSFWAASQRYFVLEDGILHYATTRQDVSQGLCRGSGDNCGPRMLRIGRGLLESTRAESDSSYIISGCGVLGKFLPWAPTPSSLRWREYDPLFVGLSSWRRPSKHCLAQKLASRKQELSHLCSHPLPVLGTGTEDPRAQVLPPRGCLPSPPCRFLRTVFLAPLLPEVQNGT